jgi:hypothetical protein
VIGNWRRKLAAQWWIVPALMFVGVRFATYLVLWVANRNRPATNPLGLITQWDAGWNSVVAGQGYVEMPDMGTGVERFMTLAFFPVVPKCVQAIHEITGLTIERSGVFFCTVTGFAGVLVLWRLIQRRYSDEVATDSTLLLLVSPFAFVLSMFYTEGPTLLMIALCFTALDRKRWIWAGLAALVVGSMRPNGFLIFVPCFVAAILAFRGSRDWKAFIAPLLAPLGFLAWIGYVWHRTSEVFGYFTIQSKGWGASFDWGQGTWEATIDLVTHQWKTSNLVISPLMLFAIGVLGLVLAYRRRMDWVWFSYAAAVVFLTATNSRQASSGRFLLLAFPLFVAFALSIPKRWLPMVAAMSAVVMGGFFYSVTGPGSLVP